MQLHGIVYCATNQINGKMYIGQTIRTLQQRKKAHLNKCKNKNKCYFHCAIQKYEKKNFIWSTLFKCYSRNQLNEAEKYFIEKFNSFGKNGYNMAIGGNGSEHWHHTKETKEKISKANKGQIAWNKGKHNHLSIETREKLSKAHEEKIPWNKGKKCKPLSKKHKQKISNSMKGEKNHFYGKSHSEKTLNKMKKTKKNISNVTRKRLSDSHLGQIAWNKGKSLSTEHKRKISENHANVKGKNNPNYGKTGVNSFLYGKSHLLATKEKMKKAHLKYWINKKGKMNQKSTYERSNKKST